MMKYTWDYKNSSEKGLELEVVKTLYVTIMFAFNELKQKYSDLTDVKFIIETSPSIVAFLQQLPDFMAEEDIEYFTDEQFVGKLGHIDVVRDMKQLINEIDVRFGGAKDEGNEFHMYTSKIEVKGLV